MKITDKLKELNSSLEEEIKERDREKKENQERFEQDLSQELDDIGAGIVGAALNVKNYIEERLEGLRGKPRADTVESVRREIFGPGGQLKTPRVDDVPLDNFDHLPKPSEQPTHKTNMRT